MKQFSLPSLLDREQASCSCVFNKKTYNFLFKWCEEFVLMDMYFIQNGCNTYILKGFPLVQNCNLIGRVKNPDIITGSLFVKNKFNDDVDISQENFETDFELVYYDEDFVNT